MIKTDRAIYRTRTLKEYDWLMKKLEEAGCMWAGGKLPTAPEVADHWEKYLLKTCIRLDYQMITFADFDFYKNESEYKDYEFIEVSELMENDDEPEIEILDKLEDLKRIEDEFKNLCEKYDEQYDEQKDKSQKIKKIVFTTEVYFE